MRKEKITLLILYIYFCFSDTKYTYTKITYIHKTTFVSLVQFKRFYETKLMEIKSNNTTNKFN